MQDTTNLIKQYTHIVKKLRLVSKNNLYCSINLDSSMIQKAVSNNVWKVEKIVSSKFCSPHVTEADVCNLYVEHTILLKLF